MTRAEDLLKALNGLRKAAANELGGEARTAALQQVTELFRLAGFDGEDAGDGGEHGHTFAQALAEVRTQAEGELCGNSFYLASKILDDLAGSSSPPLGGAVESAPSPVQVAETESIDAAVSLGAGPAEAAPRRPARAAASFDELAESARARVEEAARSLGQEAGRLGGLPEPEDSHEYHDPFAGVEWEKRSSEPCFMPEIEIAPFAGEPAASSPKPPAGVNVEAASAREVAEATHDFGTPAIEAEPASDHAALPAEPRLAFERSEPEPAGRAPEAAPASAAPKIPPVTAVEKIGAKPKEHEREPEKTFFRLWLDVVFGRKK